MNETSKKPTEPKSDFERSAKQAFDASVRGVDAATRARLVAARERAIHAFASQLERAEIRAAFTPRPRAASRCPRA